LPFHGKFLSFRSGSPDVSLQSRLKRKKGRLKRDGL
jgi:hypothetical protein